MKSGHIIKTSSCILISLCFFVPLISARSISRPGHTAAWVSVSSNLPPVANAGTDQEITNPLDSILLDGSASYDPDGTIVTYQWDCIGGPGIYQFADTNLAMVRVRDLKVGTYLFQLTVTDNFGASSSDTVSLVVNIMPTPPPTDTDVINCGQAFTIVVLGSSTAYGIGASPIDSSWVNKFTGYITAKNSQNRIINLAVPGYTTYQVLCPDNFVPPANRPSPDTAHNISAALEYHPNAIIVNLPTNDVANGYTISEQQVNYARAMAIADSANIPVWVTTTQPRNDITDDGRDSLKIMRDWTFSTFGVKALNFWTTVADTNGLIVNVYNYDNIHVDNYGHYIFYIRVVASKILDSLCNRFRPPIPVANAGNDTVITLPNSAVTLNGTESYETGGNINMYVWKKISGPAVYNIADTTAATTTVTGLEAGVYQFQLTVTDAYGIQAMDTIIITVNNPVVLAVGLFNLNAVIAGSTVKVVWNTQNDLNVLKYEIDRSGNGLNFSFIGTKPSDQSYLPTAYYYYDNNPLPGINYYRLKVYNNNNTLNFSNTIQLNFQNSPGAFYVYPNPVANELNLHFGSISQGRYQASIINSEGQTILTQQLASNGIDGTLKISLPVSIPPGVYLVLITGNAGSYKQSFLVK